jgi:hypothetical protein
MLELVQLQEPLLVRYQQQQLQKVLRSCQLSKWQLVESQLGLFVKGGALCTELVGLTADASAGAAASAAGVMTAQSPAH